MQREMKIPNIFLLSHFKAPINVRCVRGGTIYGGMLLWYDKVLYDLVGYLLRNCVPPIVQHNLGSILQGAYGPFFLGQRLGMWEISAKKYITIYHHQHMELDRFSYWKADVPSFCQVVVCGWRSSFQENASTVISKSSFDIFLEKRTASPVRCLSLLD